MSLLHLIVALVAVGICLWALNTFVPMDGKVKMILNVVVILILVVWLLQAFGLIGAANAISVPRVR